MFSSLTLTGEQIRAARALGRLEQAELARRCGLSLETIKRLERIRGPVDANSRTLVAIAEGFRMMDIEFEAEKGVGVRMVGTALASKYHPLRTKAGNGAAVGPMHRLTYYSSMAPQVAPRLKAMLDEVLETSRKHNARLGVTGALLACGGRFLQVLEGDKQAVLQIYGAICMDARHAGLQIVESRPIGSRQFDDWNLCCGEFAADGAVFRREPALKEGFRPEVLTPASALGLLSVMRELQRDPPRTRRGLAGACPLAGECLDATCVASAA